MNLSRPTIQFPALPSDLQGKLNSIKKYALSIFPQYGLERWDMKFDNARSRGGQCAYFRGAKTGTISLSIHLISFNDVSAILDTLLHEMAHAIHVMEAGESDHGWRWQQIARAIGCNGNRTFTKEEKAMPDGKYVYECPKCSKQTRRHKRSNKNRACGVCCTKYNGGRYTDEFRLIYRGVNIQLPVIVEPKNLTVMVDNSPKRMIQLYSENKTVSQIATLLGVKYSKVYFVIADYKKSNAAA